MKRFLCTLVALGLTGASLPVQASCRWFGTQLDCELGNRQVVIGTQAAAEPGRVRDFPVQPLYGGDGLLDARPGPGRPLVLELQNVGTDPGLCWRFGDETYCH